MKLQFLMTPCKFLVTQLITGVLIGCSVSASAQSFDTLEELRAWALANLGPETLGAGYAAMINFASNPDISTANFRIEVDNGEHSKLDVTRLPIKHLFPSFQSSDWHPFVSANLAYQKLAFNFDFTEQDRIDSKWTAYGGTIAAGTELLLNEHLKALAAVNTGIVRMENKANYSGPISAGVFKPAFDGIVFNWNADAWLAGISLGSEYSRDFRKFDFNINGSLSHNYIDTFDSSSGYIVFNSQATTFSLHAETRHPTDYTIIGFPMALKVYYGGTTFFGPDRHQMGFSYFFETGLALEADVQRLKHKVNRLHIGAKILYGEEVIGWSVLAGYTI